MSAEDILGLLVPATFLGMWAIEAKWPARTFPQPKGRRWLGIGFFILMALVTTIVPLAIPASWLERH